MAILKTQNVKISALCCALPGDERDVYQVGRGFFEDETIRKTTEPIGVEKLYFADEGQTASDLCFFAAKHLIEKTAIAAEEIDGLIFATQTPDYPAPATSCILQDRLGLTSDCFTMDINAGCSAFVDAYFIAANMIQGGACRKILILIGDTLRRNISPGDKGLTFIISDAASAVLVERTGETIPSTTIVKTRGSGFESLIIPAGGSREPVSDETGEMQVDGDGSKRSLEDMYMNGMDVFTFAVKEVPVIIKEVAELHEIDVDDIDYFLLHQANAYMLKFIAKRAKIPMEKMPVNISKYGNTNGSTIPFLICDLAGSELSSPRDVIFSGFGIGLSWGAAVTRLGGFSSADIIRV